MKAAVKVKSCPRHYGIRVSRTYADPMGVDRSSKKQPEVVTKQLIWLVRKGDLILRDEPIVSTFDLECKFTSKHLKMGQSHAGNNG